MFPEFLDDGLWDEAGDTGRTFRVVRGEDEFFVWDTLPPLFPGHEQPPSYCSNHGSSMSCPRFMFW